MEEFANRFAQDPNFFELDNGLGQKIPLDGITIRYYTGKVISVKTTLLGHEDVVTHLTPDQLVKLLDGKFKAAKDLKYGEWILSDYNNRAQVTGVEIKCEVKNIRVYEPETTQEYQLQKGGPILRNPVSGGGIESSSTPIKVVYTTKFTKNSKGRLNEEDIQNAIDKIKKGLGHQEWLYQVGAFSMQTDKGSRVYFNWQGNTLILEDFKVSSVHPSP